MTRSFFLFFWGISISHCIYAQRFGSSSNVIEIEETMESYLKENHLEDIENIVHKFTGSRVFLNYLLEQGHEIDMDSVKLKNRDVSVGTDIDVYVKHFTEHQNYTMLLVPVSIYPLMIYDTLLFSVLEVSDPWLHDKYYYHDLSVDSIKIDLLATMNHDLITRHMFDQVMENRHQENAEIDIHLDESYIYTNSVILNTKELDKEERRSIMHSWGAMKRIFTHNLEMNVEMNIYVFGYDEMKIIQYEDGQEVEYRITPRNVFTRHQFISK